MATTWTNGAASNKWNVAGNWSAGLPDAATDAIFDNTSVANCDLTDGAMVCKTLTIAATYSGNFDSNGQTLTVSGDCLFDGTGTLTLDAAIVLDADGDFHIGSGVGALSISTTTATLDVQGTSNIDIDKTGAVFNTLTLAANTKTTTWSGASHNNGCRNLVIGAGTFTVNTVIFLVDLRAGSTVTINGSATIDGTGFFTFSTAAGATFDIPAATYGCDVRIDFGGFGPGVIRFTGNMTISSSQTLRVRTVSNQTGTLNLNGNDLAVDGLFQCGSNVGGITQNINLGAGAFTCGSFESTTVNTGPQNFNMDSATISCEGNWAFGSNTTLDKGTATLTLDGSGNQNLTLAGETFPALIVANTGGTVQLLDAFSGTSIDSNDGVFDQNGQTISCTGTIDFNATDNLTLDAAITMTGDGNMIVGTNPTMLAATSNIDLQGTGNLGIRKTWSGNITCAANGKTTTLTQVLSIEDKVLTFSNGGTFTGTPNLFLRSTTETDPFVPNGATISSPNIFAFYIFGDITVNIPTFSTTGQIHFQSWQAGGTGCKFDIQGALSCSRTQIVKNQTGAMEIDFNSHAFTTNTGSIKITSGHVTAGLTVTCDSASFDIKTDLDCDNSNNTLAFNFGSSTWNIERDIIFGGTNLTVDKGTATITLDGSGNQNITSDGETLPALTIANTGGTVQLQDSFLGTSIDANDGNLDFNTQTVGLTGAFDWDSADTLTWDSTMTISGDAGCHLGNIGTISVASASLTLQGTGNLDIDKAALTFANMTLAANGKVTTVNGDETFAVSNVLTIGAGTLTINSAVLVVPTAQVNPLVVNGSATINGTSTLGIDFGAALTINIPAITTTGTVGFVLQNSTAFAGVYNINGTVSSVDFSMQKSLTGTLTVNTNDNDITGSTTLSISNENAVGALTIAFGASTVTCGNFNVLDNTGVQTLTFGTSQWTISGDWTFGSNSAPTYGAGASFSFIGTPTITTSNKDMPYCLFSNDAAFTGSFTIERLNFFAGKVYTFADGATVTLTSYTDTDWDGAAGDKTELVSSNPGVSWLLVNPASMRVRNVDVTDSDASGGENITALTSDGCVDGGNNSSEWIFSLPVSVSGEVGQAMSLSISM